MEHLTLPVLDANETEVVFGEVLEVEPLGDGGFELLHSPAFVWGIAAGDVIDLDPDELSGFRVRSRAGNVAVVIAVEDPADRVSLQVQSLTAAIEALGGSCDGGPGRLLVYTIPVSVGFGRIEAAFNTFRDSLAGGSWWYGNVLDRDDRPLRWWEGHAG